MRQIGEFVADRTLANLQPVQQQAPYAQNIEKDDIQSLWVEKMRYTQMGKFVDTRPDKKKTGIYVDKGNTMDRKMDERIDSVIKKFMQDKMNNF